MEKRTSRRSAGMKAPRKNAPSTVPFRYATAPGRVLGALLSPPVNIVETPGREVRVFRKLDVHRPVAGSLVAWFGARYDTTALDCRSRRVQKRRGSRFWGR